MASRTTTYKGYGSAPKVPEGIILGFGNPLLDISANVEQAFLDKYGLKLNNAILAEEKHEPLYKEMVTNYDVDYIAGGATQNAIRIAQWMLQSEGATSFVGAIGNDEFGSELKKVCELSGVTPHYYVSMEKPTGLCAVTVFEKERSLTTKLEAANEYKHSHTLSEPVQKIIRRAQIYYIASFFLTVPEGPETVLHVAQHALEHHKVFALNLSAEFLIDFFADQLNKCLPFTDFVFCNETEAALFGKKHGWGEDLCEIALKLSAMPKNSGSRPRIVVFSQGPDPTIVAMNGKVTLFPVPKLKEELLVDTNGAGDSFVGGFLSRLAMSEAGVVPFDITECIRAGHYAARVIVQNSGCACPPQPDFA